MQVLRYETGQFYKTHHDQNSPRASAWGSPSSASNLTLTLTLSLTLTPTLTRPRMFTVFMYVGDGYEGGDPNPDSTLTLTPAQTLPLT